VDFHLLVDGGTTVREAHVLAHQVEERLGEAVPGLEVTIHVEPVDEPASWEADQLARLGEQTEPPSGS
jgi:divalent metal cation (Fe/Co/Zn/Cd) transporter